MECQFNLLYEKLKIGRIENAFCSDDTWFGTVKLMTEPSCRDLSDRILAYVNFSEDWNQRLRTGSSTADPVEFEQYADLIKSSAWIVESDAGERFQVLGAPVFFAGGELSWRLK